MERFYKMAEASNKKFPGDVLAYSEYKNAFIEKCIAEAKTLCGKTKNIPIHVKK